MENYPPCQRSTVPVVPGQPSPFTSYLSLHLCLNLEIITITDKVNDAERTFNSPLRRIMNASEEVSVKLNRLSSGSGKLGSFWGTSSANFSPSSAVENGHRRGEGSGGGGNGEGSTSRGMKKTKGSPYNNTPLKFKSSNTNEPGSESTRDLLGSNDDFLGGSNASSFQDLHGSRSNDSLYPYATLPSGLSSSQNYQTYQYRLPSTSNSMPPFPASASYSKSSYFESMPAVSSATSTRASSPTLPAAERNPKAESSIDTKAGTDVKASTETAGSTVKRDFELTPLSDLIQQSIKDLEMLKIVYGRGGVYPSSVYTSVPGSGSGSGSAGDQGYVNFNVGSGPPTNGVSSAVVSGASGIHNGKKKGRFSSNFKDRVNGVTPVSRGVEEDEEVAAEAEATASDFDQVGEDLRMFEEMYRAYLQTPTPSGRPRTEVHLLAIICKKREILQGS
ncbi:uncharacterized protein RAG0_14874 [Rhynchosporium agropyri]|uniref:Uncharacterized protein n=1 Tax=Rhynchosporium agropyri TaxID=914238 RepID=A0A1E1LIX4_9HELO|nr:uncharacterized protein RAG0_14874 [Rhynchosporium agropyri]